MIRLEIRTISQEYGAHGGARRHANSAHACAIVAGRRIRAVRHVHKPHCSDAEVDVNNWAQGRHFFLISVHACVFVCACVRVSDAHLPRHKHTHAHSHERTASGNLFRNALRTWRSSPQLLTGWCANAPSVCIRMEEILNTREHTHTHIWARNAIICASRTATDIQCK